MSRYPELGGPVDLRESNKVMPRDNSQHHLVEQSPSQILGPGTLRASASTSPFRSRQQSPTRLGLKTSTSDLRNSVYHDAPSVADYMDSQGGYGDPEPGLHPGAGPITSDAFPPHPQAGEAKTGSLSGHSHGPNASEYPNPYEGLYDHDAFEPTAGKESRPHVQEAIILHGDADLSNESRNYATNLEAYGDHETVEPHDQANFLSSQGHLEPLREDSSHPASFLSPHGSLSASSSTSHPSFPSTSGMRKASSIYDLQSSPSPLRPGSVYSSNKAAYRMSQYDLNSSHLVPHLGEHASSLMPRIQTIELYRKNAKKSGDPEVEFQLAQYMVQTALLKNEDEETDGEKSPKSRKKKDMSEEARLKAGVLKEALSILRKLAERGSAEAQYLLGDIYSTDALDLKPDLKQSFSYFTMASKHGHAESAYRAGLCLQEGWGTSIDIPRALKYYRTAASKNQPGALFRLGVAYFYGHLGIPDNASNRQAGIKWLTRAVDAANEMYNQAPYELGRIYEQGYKDIVFRDNGYAVKLFVRSAELNYVPAAAKLGHAFEFGELGCPQDASLSIHYYTIAALGNDPKAQLAMCAWYMVGAGPHFPRNEDEAFEWALRSAHNGFPKAQYTLGFFYENAIGVDRDIFQSTSWYRRAASNGDKQAIKRLEAVNPPPTKEKKDCIVM